MECNFDRWERSILRFRLTKYGRRECVLVTLLAAVLAGLAAWLALGGSALFWSAVVAAAAVWLLVLWFFRDPDRLVPQREGLFVGPADGLVTDVTPLGPESPLGCEGLQVGIFMNVLDVHVNRSPCQARIEKVERRRGTFLDARNAAAPQKNASTTITMTHNSHGRSYPVIIRQIAGLLARRIVTDLAPAQEVRRGQRIGMIKFGSRVEVLVPRELVGKILVEVGQKVKAGQTILFTAKGSEGP